MLAMLPGNKLIFRPKISGGIPAYARQDIGKASYKIVVLLN